MHDAVLLKGVSGIAGPSWKRPAVAMFADTARASIVYDLLFSASDRV